jgi:hypothetical protein
VEVVVVGIDINALIGVGAALVGSVASGAWAAKHNADAVKDVARTEAQGTLEAAREQARLAEEAAARAASAAADQERGDATGELLAASSELRLALAAPDSMGASNVGIAQSKLGQAAGRALAAGEGQLAESAHAAAQATSHDAASDALDALTRRLADRTSRRNS